MSGIDYLGGRLGHCHFRQFQLYGCRLDYAEISGLLAGAIFIGQLIAPIPGRGLSAIHTGQA